MKGYSVLTIPTVSFPQCVCSDWLILSVLRVPPHPPGKLALTFLTVVNI